MTIYLIEDDEIYAAFVKKALEHKAYHVTVFHTAEDALAVANDRMPEAFIVDYKLPGISGIELYERIKPRVSPTQKVIMLSALDDGNMVLGFIQKGVRDYVIKDENVIDSLVAVLEGKEDDYYLFN
ncbi:MAG: response regulator [Cyclobacteriaceae bacterium]|jgi:DNA-binding response OmpR family regulator|nr:response regulator [Cyclobacteriaceae bacterium]